MCHHPYNQLLLQTHGLKLVLPHKEVGEYVQRKGNDRDRWISGMQRLQKQFEEFYQSLADQNKGEKNEN